MNTKLDISGAWTLVGSRSRTIQGKEIPSVWGERPAGHLVYTPGGQMTVHVHRTDRLNFAGDDARTGSIEEVKSCFEGYCAYYGTYEIDEVTRTVYHHVNGDLIPNFEGTSLSRTFKLEGDLLTLTTPPYVLCGEESVSDLIWKKLEGI